MPCWRCCASGFSITLPGLTATLHSIDWTVQDSETALVAKRSEKRCLISHMPMAGNSSIFTSCRKPHGGQQLNILACINVFYSKMRFHLRSFSYHIYNHLPIIQAGSLMFDRLYDVMASFILKTIMINFSIINYNRQQVPIVY